MKAKILISYYPSEPGYEIYRVYLEKHFDQAEDDLVLLKNSGTSKEYKLEESFIYPIKQKGD